MRFKKIKHFLRNNEIQDTDSNQYMNTDEVVDLLNSLQRESDYLKKLKKEYANTYNILEDFIDMTNKLQAKTEDKNLQSQARDMLIMMGVEIL